MLKQLIRTIIVEVFKILENKILVYSNILRNQISFILMID